MVSALLEGVCVGNLQVVENVVKVQTNLQFLFLKHMQYVMLVSRSSAKGRRWC